jgi:hypothetical protein
VHDSQPETNSEALVGEASTLVRNIGAPYWKTSDGRTFPRVAGAEDPPGDTDTESPTEGEKEFDKDRALATIRTQREKELKLEAELKELRGLKSRLKTLEDEKRERDDADKSEADRLKSQLATAEQKYIDAARELQDTRIRQSIERAAAKAGAADPDDVYRLLDPSALEINDEGRLVNAEKLVADLLKVRSCSNACGSRHRPLAGSQPAAFRRQDERSAWQTSPKSRHRAWRRRCRVLPTRCSKDALRRARPSGQATSAM